MRIVYPAYEKRGEWPPQRESKLEIPIKCRTIGVASDWYFLISQGLPSQFFKKPSQAGLISCNYRLNDLKFFSKEILFLKIIPIRHRSDLDEISMTQAILLKMPQPNPPGLTGESHS
ncbi:hypothetical protein GIY62_17930 [Burkholderia plantarii]|uniref:hypothetical protein n=1 Tax=Burkholderia plantarii TaxID=41899 RepID=UPI002729D10A|nr:hypothetical protein [Burkholderia plantarii]WLE58955.1 hypothetical protein GIY62_17930 [Burkholderia plantarii]